MWDEKNHAPEPERPGAGNKDESRYFLICVDSYQDQLLKGRLRNCELAGERSFDNMFQLLLAIESILDSIAFPLPAALPRRFRKAALPRPGLRPTDSLRQGQPGLLGNFGVKVLFRQNLGWQGLLTWLDQDQEESFRSVWELMLLLDSALSLPDSGGKRQDSDS